MNKDEFLNNIFVKYPTKYIPLAPLGLWWDTNRGLENYYKQNGINNMDNWKDIKNTMRHITGLARTTQAYGAPGARMLALIKEAGDFWTGNQDNVEDFRNNELGINYALNHPDASMKDLMDHAFKRALLEQKENKTLGDYLAE